jgi:hypothetical protein
MAFKSFSSKGVLGWSTRTYFLISRKPTVDALWTQHVEVLEHEHVQIGHGYDEVGPFPALEENEGVSADNDWLSHTN